MYTNLEELLTSRVDCFSKRHVGLTAADLQSMLQTLGVTSLPELLKEIIPQELRQEQPLKLTGLDDALTTTTTWSQDYLQATRHTGAYSELGVLARLRAYAAKNVLSKSYIGAGFADCLTPTVILRNVLENPGWYTAYTPYQAEISQGRLEALFYFQLLIMELTGFKVANASLLDTASAAAEAMRMCHTVRATSATTGKTPVFIADMAVHPATLQVLQTRATPLGIKLVLAKVRELDWPAYALELQAADSYLCGVLLEYPDTDGVISDYTELVRTIHDLQALVVASVDLLALTVLTPPASWGADIAVGSAQRLGVPLNFGGPHAAFLATHTTYQRQMPGRLIGLTKDSQGLPAYRMALQTREQHIRREKATSNICTAQALLAIIAVFYALYHGPEGLKAIALRIANYTQWLSSHLRTAGYTVLSRAIFDTLKIINLSKTQIAAIQEAALKAQINLRYFADGSSIGISLAETTTLADLEQLLEVFLSTKSRELVAPKLSSFKISEFIPSACLRQTPFMQQAIFQQYHTEHELLRYMESLRQKDLSLTHSLIPLGSCTMKLNPAVTLLPLSMPAFTALHPHAPLAQTRGYQEIFQELERWLCEITGFAGAFLQPNAGSQGEYAGLLVIKAYLAAKGQQARDICLIPTSAHGTNPASAIMAGLRVVTVACDERGNIDRQDLQEKVRLHRAELAVLMLTYPSTYGIFESGIQDIAALIHAAGGQVYLDGANMNAEVGLCSPAAYGADVCHLNLHKTFAIPHGGGGPGAGPICVASHLVPYLPTYGRSGDSASLQMTMAPYGSAAILPISWMYIALLGGPGLTLASTVALLNANYVLARLKSHYQVLYTNAQGRVGHEFILDLRPFKELAGIEAEDVAKRLMDFGFHAPTMSFPVAGTLMIEPTESESKAELDRFCAAMLKIREEIQDIIDKRADRQNNLLKNAPHTCLMATQTTWPFPYTREAAVYPLAFVQERKFWPAVGRVDNVFGDRNFTCSCA